eukprot:TRINITY_DN15103_c0_g1_i1.p1 TRINITY_DN15103_c0_g1~~TRINITY_DN15103_c0_g1_i1.p1  ORF type:complete len:922 (-),score=159.62 TRINITY_DN15103_c0_g1_i1:178-2943(-)
MSPATTATVAAVGAAAACSCNWEDNRWLFLIDDLISIFTPAYRADAEIVRRNTTESSGADNGTISWPLQLLDEVSTVNGGNLCGVDVAVLHGTNGVRRKFSEAWLTAAFGLVKDGNSDGADYLKDFCLPGQIATDLLCSQHAVLFKSSRAARIGARYARRLGLILPFVEDCLDASPWPLDLRDLRAYVDQWEAASDFVDSANAGLPIFVSVLTPKPREKLPELLRRCMPLKRSDACWARRARALSNSCALCCDPKFPRGHSICFGEPWTFEKCCTPDDLHAGWSPAPPVVEKVVGIDKEEDLKMRDLEELRAELRDGCVVREPARELNDRATRASTSVSPREAALHELRRWLADAKSRQYGLQRVFPELDLFISTKACVGPEVELPWFVLRGSGKEEEDDDELGKTRGSNSDRGASSGSSLAGDLDRRSAVEIAAAYGAVCGAGIPVAGEVVSQVGFRVMQPCAEQVAMARRETDVLGHRLEPYGLELMRRCRLLPDGQGCGCGAPWCDGIRSCCRGGDDDVEWRDVGLLLGELRTNIAHAARDALWLHRLLHGDTMGNTSLAALLSTVGGKRPKRWDLVLTKHAATECIEDGQCVRTGRDVVFAMESFMAEIAVEDTRPWPRTLHAGDPARLHPVCFEVVAQRWRPWAGDARSIQDFRARALRKCGISDGGMRRKVVLIRRDSSTRQWRDEGAVRHGIEAIARTLGSSFYVVNLGQLQPCEQVEALHDTALLLGVHGADLTNMIFLPAGAAVVEVAVECEVEGGSIDSPFWRGPGTRINGSIRDEAAALWRRKSAEGQCPLAGAIDDAAGFQAYPTSQFAKLARQANLFYTAVMDCSGMACDHAAEAAAAVGGVWDRGWCTGHRNKKRRYVEVDLPGRLLPAVWVMLQKVIRDIPLQNEKAPPQSLAVDDQQSGLFDERL